MLPKIQAAFKDNFQLIVVERPQSVNGAAQKRFVGESDAETNVHLEYSYQKGRGHFNLNMSIRSYMDASEGQEPGVHLVC